MKTIVDYGFVKNPFPIILSVENHCNTSQQQKMFEIIRNICGGYLFVLPENYENYEYLPSPQDLLYKILMKTKVPLINPSKSPKGMGTNEVADSFNKSFEKSTPHKINIIQPESQERQKSLKDYSCLSMSEDNYTEYIQQKDENLEKAFEAQDKFFLDKNLNIRNKMKIKLKKEKIIESKNETFSSNSQSPLLEVHQSPLLEVHHKPSKNVLNFMKVNENNILINKSHSENVLNSPVFQQILNLQKISSMVAIENLKIKKNQQRYSSQPEQQTSFMNSSNNDSHNFEMQGSQFSPVNLSNYRKKVIFSQSLTFDAKKINKNFRKCISLVGLKANLKDLNNRSVFTVYSLNESRIANIFNKNEILLINFHRRYLSRIYPSGTRIDSSNFDPMNSILSGSQMIALNIQTADIYLLIYNSMFQTNGGVNSGYILKPKFLRYDYDSTKNKYPSTMKKIKKVIQIQILSGQRISANHKNNNSIYLEVSLKGTKFDELNNKVFKSQTIKKNMLYAIFNLDIQFKIRCPKVCFIIFQIYAKNDVISNERIAWYCIPFSSIREGYRVIPLLNNMFYPIENSLLLAHVEISKPFDGTEKMNDF